MVENLWDRLGWPAINQGYWGNFKFRMENDTEMREGDWVIHNRIKCTLQESGNPCPGVADQRSYGVIPCLSSETGPLIVYTNRPPYSLIGENYTITVETTNYVYRENQHPLCIEAGVRTDGGEAYVRPVPPPADDARRSASIDVLVPQQLP